MPLPDSPFDVTCMMQFETAKAIKFNDGTKDFWIPKSLIASEDIQVNHNETGTTTLTVPHWFALKNGLI